MARQYRFFTEDLEAGLLEQDVVLHSRCELAAFEQLTRVLRVKPDDVVVLLPGRNNTGFEYWFRVVSAHKKEVALQFEKRVENNNELDFELELVVALPNKLDTLAMILQKSVELGVTKVTLVEGDYSQLRHGLRQERLQRIMKEAAEQSERVVLPALELGGKLVEYIKELDEQGRQRLWVAVEREPVEPLASLARERQGNVAILIGPEGGFSDAEKKLFTDYNVKQFTLGPRILRMETAVIVALGSISSYTF